MYAGSKETDNSYHVTYEFKEPLDITFTKMYVDAATWNCMDSRDNDHDCLIDCADPDCDVSLGATAGNCGMRRHYAANNNNVCIPATPNSKEWYTTNITIGLLA